MSDILEKCERYICVDTNHLQAEHYNKWYAGRCLVNIRDLIFDYEMMLISKLLN